MSTILERDARPISDLQTKTAELLAHIQQTGRPILLKKNGKPAAVLISPESFTTKIEGKQVYIVRIRHQAQKPLTNFED